MKKKKFKILTLSMQNSGHGTFPRHERMANALAKAGHKVVWISPKGYQNKKFIKINILLNFIPDFLFIGIYFKLLLTCIFYRELIRNIDYVLAIREYDAISLFFNPFFKNTKKIFFSRGDVISILNVNLPDRTIFQKLKDKVIIIIYPLLQRLIYGKLNLIIFQANFLKKNFFRRIKVEKKNSRVLPNDCITQKNFYPRKRLDKKITIGFAAPMYWSCKGLSIIVDLYKKLIKENIDFDLLLAGDGPHTQKLVSKLDKISSKKFKWLGWVKDISLFFKKIDLVIIPSKFDSCPNLLLEAISYRKIIFASNIMAHKEILKNNEFTFDINKIDELKNKILKFQSSIDYNENLKKKIVNAYVKNNFNWDKKFLELVEKC